MCHHKGEHRHNETYADKGVSPIRGYVCQKEEKNMRAGGTAERVKKRNVKKRKDKGEEEKERINYFFDD